MLGNQVQGIGVEDSIAGENQVSGKITGIHNGFQEFMPAMDI